MDVDDLLGDPFGRRGMPGADSVAEDDVEFAYIKATEGEDFIDDRFEANWQAVQEAGLDRGAYHFFTLCTPGDDQAENFLQVALPDSNALAPAVDLELAGNCSARPPRSDVHSDLRNFIERVEDAWQREVLLYLGDDFESFYEVREVLDRPLWLRRFLLRPRGDWAIWQLHGYATVEGVSGGVDLDVMRQPQE
ncbi:MAG: GH25 family lysozyme [Actinomycetota bacterium]